MKVCLYARHSSDKQENSSKDQLRRCREWCELRGYNVVATFVDEALSGASVMARKGLHQLYDYVLLEDVDKVIAEDLSRISRDQEDIAHFCKRMFFLDIDIETIEDGPVGELQIGFKGTMNALYLKSLAEKNLRGMISAALKGSVPGGKAFGYDLLRRLDDRGEIIRGQRTINENEAEIVRHVFGLYTEGLTLADICFDLNSRGILSPKGGKWVSSSLIGSYERQTGLLRQTLYSGVLTFNKLGYRRNPVSGKRNSFIKPEQEWIRVPMPEYQILEDDLFETVQRLIEQRSSVSRKKKKQRLNRSQEEDVFLKKQSVKKSRKKLLRNKEQDAFLVKRNVKCGHCGSSMISLSQDNYGCVNKECHNRSFSRKVLEPLAYKALWKFDVNQLNKEMAILQSGARELFAKRGILSEELKDKNARVRRVLEKFAEGTAGAMTKDYVNDLEIEAQQVQFEISKLDVQLSDYGYERGQLPDLYEKIDFLQELIKLCNADPKNKDAVECLNNIAGKVIVTSDSENKENVQVDVEVNVPALLGRLLRHIPGLSDRHNIKPGRRRSL